MNTVVRARLHPQRSLSYDTFAAITDAAVRLDFDRTTGEWVVTFDRDIDAASSDQLAADRTREVWELMTSRDDADLDARHALRDADGATNLAEMVRAYVLGDPMPDPLYP